MDHNQLHQWAALFVRGELQASEFMAQIRSLESASLSDATVDLERASRCGYPEVIYAAGKTNAALVQIMGRLVEAGQPILATRVSEDQAAHVGQIFPQVRHNRVARTLRIDDGANDDSDAMSSQSVAIVTAGTSDLPVAEEARETIEWMGQPTFMIQDVGVAGPHRLPPHVPMLRSAAVVIVVAGMEGALPSVVGGYVACPVIAVPTSVGYGAAFGGITALLGMLNSCASNVTVVNIDAGFKAGYLAGLIASRTAIQA